MGWYTSYMELLDDAYATGDLGYPAYCVLAEAAGKLRSLGQRAARPATHA